MTPHEYFKENSSLIESMIDCAKTIALLSDFDVRGYPGNWKAYYPDYTGNCEFNHDGILVTTYESDQAQMGMPLITWEELEACYSDIQGGNYSVDRTVLVAERNLAVTDKIRSLKEQEATRQANLKTAKDQQERAEYERLKKKFEGE